MGIPGAAALDRALPVIVAGMGPGGAATAIGLRRAGVDVIGVEARGAVANRARSIAVRPQTREIFHTLTGGTLRANEAIMDIENPLRRTAEAEGVDARYGQKLLGWTEHAGHVRAQLQDAATGAKYTIKGSALVDASGGRIAGRTPIGSEREMLSPSHVYATAQFRDRAPSAKMAGVYDQKRQELLALLPVGDREDGFVAYLDLQPGQGVTDEQALLARFDQIRTNLGLREPISPPQVFDAQAYVVKNASSKRSIEIGNSVGVADPYIGAGLAASLVDAQHAVQALTGTKGTLEQRLAGAARESITGHRLLAQEGQAIVDVRHLAGVISAKNVPLDRATMADVGPMHAMDTVANLIRGRRIYDGTWQTYGSFLEAKGASLSGKAGAVLGSAYAHASNAISIARDPLGWLTRSS